MTSGSEEEISIIDYDEEYARETVTMWRASKERALGIPEVHSFDDHVKFLRTGLVQENDVFLAVDEGSGGVVGIMATDGREVNQLYVHLDHQRRGIGSRLLQLAKDRSSGTLRLFTFEVNEGAQAFYESRGFKEIGRGFENEENLPHIRYEWTRRMVYREITPADMADIFRVRVATRENAFTLEELAKLGITEASVKHMIAATHKGWLCEVGGETVGFAMGDKSSGEMWVIAVLPGYEGRGIGMELIRRVVEWLFGNGWDEIWLTTDVDTSLRAYGFYRNSGWADREIREGLRYMVKSRPAPKGDRMDGDKTGWNLHEGREPGKERHEF